MKCPKVICDGITENINWFHDIILVLGMVLGIYVFAKIGMLILQFKEIHKEKKLKKGKIEWQKKKK